MRWRLTGSGILRAVLQPLAGAAQVLAAAAALAAAPSSVPGQNMLPPQDALPPLSASTSLLVIAPHPDDETLCCAGAIQRVLASGGRVAVVWVTSGDGSELDLLLIERSLLRSPERLQDLAARRMAEARNAMTRLGVPAANLYFLGYPDRGILPLVTDYWDGPLRSAFTGAMTVPYADALAPGHPYTGANLEADLTRVLELAQPTLVLAPAPADTHPDHRASAILAMRTVGRFRPQPRLRFWIVHGGEGWPAPRGLHSELPQTPAPRALRLEPLAFPLTAAEIAGKESAVAAYRTQRAVMASFLEAFVRSSELYLQRSVPEPPALPRRPAHAAEPAR